MAFANHWGFLDVFLSPEYGKGHSLLGTCKALQDKVEALQQDNAHLTSLVDEHRAANKKAVRNIASSIDTVSHGFASEEARKKLSESLEVLHKVEAKPLRRMKSSLLLKIHELQGTDRWNEVSLAKRVKHC